jgi:hypothetical protein
MKQVILKVFKNETFIAVLLVSLTTLITYGVSIPRLGFYYDDWYVLWSGQARGAASLIPLFSTDRPFMGVVYSQVYHLLGDTIVNWHLYALLWRMIGGLAFFWILRLLWPEHKYLTTLMAVLFVIYPGFLSQPDANTKQNHLYGFGTALLSIGFMLQAIKLKSKVWKIIFFAFSILLTVNYLFIYEYMIGLEGMRFVLLGVLLYQQGFKKYRILAVEVFKRWWPFVLAAAGFLYWRFFIFESSRVATNPARLAGSYLGNLRHMSIRLVLEITKDFLDTSIFAWFVKPYFLISGAQYSDLGFALLVATFVIILVWLYLFLSKKWWGTDYQAEEKPRPFVQFLWIGALITLCAVAPVIASGRNVDLTDSYKSYGLHPIGGVVIFVAGLVLMLQPKFRRLILIALIGISVSAQVLNASGFWVQFWRYERETWWQLTWRAPDIRDGTLVMAYLPDGYRLQQDYEIWGPVNLIYRPGPAESPAISAEVLTQDTVYDIFTGEVIDNRVRDIKLHKDYNDLLLISLPARNACIHLIDGTLPVYSENESLLLQQVGGYSHIDRIVPTGNAPIPPAAIFGPEPPHNWCYYYQKAALARQVGDWKEIGKLYDQTIALGLEPSDQSEILPFFEGLVNLGRIDEAKKIYNQEIKGRKQLRYPLCNFLSKDPGYPPEFHYDYQMIDEILCKS